MKKRGIFWVTTPATLVAAGFIILALNQLTTAGSSTHRILNLIDFFILGVGFIAFVPGLIYGIILLNKK